ncbi:MAG: hypothetical protein MJZ75_02740 [Paludibacteraceae bacterium]|nr:hypothetical protein [Paludibacteraceae bacterium]
MYVHATMYEGARSAGYKGEDFVLTQEEPSQEQSTGSRFFSVSATKSVEFAPGNLQYRASTKTWRFAEHQYDYIGADNANISNSYSGWIDLFGWSTNKTYFGVSTSMEDASFYGNFVDWGKNIINGDKANTWRTLTIDEWSYVCLNRPNASKLQGVASVNGVGGMILLPDGWVCPSGIKFVSGFAANGSSNYSALNEYSISQWQKMEDAGAIFLPVTGMRLGDGISIRTEGRYWSASSYAANNACDVIFDSRTWYDIPSDGLGGRVRYAGLAVRLVKVDTPDLDDEQQEEQNEEQFRNNHAYVDLGLSVKWANMNVGATTPECYGDYFAWGETSPKTTYSWSTYKYCQGSSTTMTKYCKNSSYGTVDKKTVLDPEDDAAHVNWGGNWRMPTKAEQYELIKNCTWTWTSNYNSTGVKGYIVKSTKNGNSIFLPASGYYDSSLLYGVGVCGDYWSSSLFDVGTSSFLAGSLRFISNEIITNYYNRYYGNPVRAVCE